MRTRALLILSFVLVALAVGPRQSGSADTARMNPADVPVLRTAALHLKTQPRSAVLRWLRMQSPVASAVLAPDHQTLDVLFRDGQDMTIVPRSMKQVRLPLRSTAVRLHPRLRPHQTPAGKALVAEPFAFEIGGPDIGDPEVAYLRGAGFQVDYLLNGAVNIGLMQRLALYSVVYFHTHSGVDRNNNAVIVTGVLATTPNPPDIQALINDGTVGISGIAGSSDTYYKIQPEFVPRHMGKFPKDSIVFLNGCQLLGTNLQAAFLAQGVATVVGWDNETQTTDSYFTASAFFYFMSQGQTVADAVKSTVAAGAGKSTYGGATSTFGSGGDGTNTFARALLGGQPTSPTVTSTPLPPPTGAPPPPPGTITPLPAATNTPIPTAEPPTATPLPPTATTVPATATAVVPTATLAAPPVTILSLANLVKPGARQVVRIQQLAPASQVHYFVAYPNGDTVEGTVTTDVNGAANFGFLQAPSKITRDSSVALVTIQGQVGTQLVRNVTITAQYQIAFGKIDIAAQPRDPVAGQDVTIWVHTKPNTSVKVIPKSKKLHTHTSITGSGGWTHVTLKVPAGAAAGTKIDVRTEATLKGKLVHTSTSFTVK